LPRRDFHRSGNYVDPTYKSRKHASRKAGLLTGGYHFLRPGNMARQASWLLSNAAFDELDRVCIDHEDEGVSQSRRLDA
jgi:GH25 family lysozyme M1 (1,4-beta-N-acetylmuramidase)